MTMTRSESMMVSVRWAMVSTVLDWNARRMVCWINRSVSRSTLAVASSTHITFKRTRQNWIIHLRFCEEDDAEMNGNTLALRSKALARQINCFWPVESNLPRSRTSVDRPPQLETRSARWHSSSAFHSSRSVNCPVGSKFSPIVPLKMKGSCGMMAIRDLRTSNKSMSSM